MSVDDLSRADSRQCFRPEHYNSLGLGWKILGVLLMGADVNETMSHTNYNNIYSTYLPTNALGFPSAPGSEFLHMLMLIITIIEC
jgi:hypothetical protein